MLFWGLVGALSLLVLAGILGPLLRDPGRQARSADYDLAVYQDQLAELERNRESGMIGAQEAEAARAEIGRRILEADKRRQKAQAREQSGTWPVRAGAAAAVVAVAGALGTYIWVGNPDREAVPFAERQSIPKSREAIVAARQGGMGGQGQARGSGGMQAGAGGSGASGSGMPDVATAEKQLAERLEKNPDDIRGWLLLGRTRMQMQNYAGALEAFGKARELAPDNPRIAASYAEAMVMANEGRVTPKAKTLFARASEAEPDNPQPNYYLALAEFQQGNPEAALARWKDMVANARPDARWLDVVKKHMAAAEKQLGMPQGETYASVAPEPAANGAAEGGESGAGQGPTRDRAQASGGTAGAGAGGGQPSGPTREQMQAAQDMSPEAREKMIQGMVDRLAKRLEDNPDNLQGWTRLARSYNVLGKPEKAREALKKATEIAPENVDLLAQYARAIRRAAGDKQTEKSIAVSRRILKLDQDNAEALWFVGVHEARKGNTEKARDLFDKALATLPDSPQTKELRRRAEEMVGDG
jgi:cytochrome c-type biogenesis protein CcmH